MPAPTGEAGHPHRARNVRDVSAEEGGARPAFRRERGVCPDVPCGWYEETWESYPAGRAGSWRQGTVTTPNNPTREGRGRRGVEITMQLYRVGPNGGKT